VGNRRLWFSNWGPSKQALRSGNPIRQRQLFGGAVLQKNEAVEANSLILESVTNKSFKLKDLARIGPLTSGFQRSKNRKLGGPATNGTLRLKPTPEEAYALTEPPTVGGIVARQYHGGIPWARVTTF
jgi:hypothetical protein